MKFFTLAVSGRTLLLFQSHNKSVFRSFLFSLGSKTPSLQTVCASCDRNFDKMKNVMRGLPSFDLSASTVDNMPAKCSQMTCMFDMSLLKSHFQRPSLSFQTDFLSNSVKANYRSVLSKDKQNSLWLQHSRINILSSHLEFPSRCFTIKKKDYQFPVVREEDLEEKFVRGSGPGGQNVNQTANCVNLKHIPTGLVVKCHASRSLQENRKQARVMLQERLDVKLHGENSYQSQVKAESRSHKQEKKRRAKDRLLMKRAFKERKELSSEEVGKVDSQ